MFLNKARYLRLVFLFFCIAFGNSVSAQFWKKSSRTHKVNSSSKYPIKPTQKPAAKIEKKKEEKKKRVIDYPQSVKKERYRIDVLIPLYLDELVVDEKTTFKGRIPEKAQAGINFYEGIKLAVDTLTYMGYKTDVFVHDVSAKGAEIDHLIQTDSLKNTDLIIGYVSSQDVTDLAEYAASKKVNFVSAFSPSDANIKNNPYFFLLNPTLENNCYALVKSLLKKRKEEPVIIFKRETLSVDSSAYHYIIDSMEIKSYAEIDCNKLPDSAMLSSVLDSIAKNMILMPIMDANYAERMIRDLKKYFPTYRFEIYGMPTWKGITATRKMIDLGALIEINLTQPYNFDQNISMNQVIASKYKSVFGGKPNELTYRGFELVFWLTDLLNKYGAIFNEKTSDNAMAIFTRFDLKPKWDKENNFYYNENKNLYLYHYQAGTFSIE